MATIAPCITVQTISEFQTTVNTFQPFAERVHIDLSDGEFAPRKLIDPKELSWPEDWQVDIHMMVKRPREYLQHLVSLKPSTIILHAEADEDLLPLLGYIKDNGVKPGLALLRLTVPSDVEQYIKASEHVMIFSGDLGHYGGEASLMQIEKVRLIRRIKENLEIAWDGGVSVENAFTLVHGGVDVLNSGGAVNNAEDPQAAYNNLVREANRQSMIV